MKHVLDTICMGQTDLRPLLGALAGRNSFEGYVPSVPDGEKLDFGSDRCCELEERGDLPNISLDSTLALHELCTT